MILGLTDVDAGFVTYVQQHDPLTYFASTNSRLELEETTMILCATRESSSSNTATLLVKITTDEVIIATAPAG